MNILQAILLGIVEGLTEFLPVSSTAHLTIVEKIMGLRVDAPDVTAFTAVIQIGAIVAVLVYFRRDIMRLVLAWFRGFTHRKARDEPEYRLAWAVIVGSIPIGIIGFALRNIVAGPLRSLWVIVAGLLIWSVVMIVAERVASYSRTEMNIRVSDGVVVGIVQCFALVPGVSRSGATISAGLFRGLDRVAATRLSFLLSIPALLAAGAYESASKASAIGSGIGWAPTLVATVVSFLVALAAIAWLLRLVARHSIAVFVWYRVGLAIVVSALLFTGVLSSQ